MHHDVGGGGGSDGSNDDDNNGYDDWKIQISKPRYHLQVETNVVFIWNKVSSNP